MTDLRRENGWRDDLWDGGIKRGRELQAKEDKAEIDKLRAENQRLKSVVELVKQYHVCIPGLDDALQAYEEVSGQ